ncbi:hypothetical protein TSAR_016230, partial [Trichomalopsis sarcophagae]
YREARSSLRLQPTVNIQLAISKDNFKIRGVNSLLRSWQSRNDYKITPNRIGLKPRIALSIRAYESQMTEQRSLKLLICRIYY